MKLKNTLLLGALMACACVGSASAADFFDTGTAEKTFVLGARIGINTTNRTVNDSQFNTYNHNSWGLGFNCGVVADLYLRDYISLQPGLFFQCRSGNHTYIQTWEDNTAYVQYGHSRRYDLSIPVLCSVHFNLSDDVRWHVEAGPYLQINLGNQDDDFYAGYTPETIERAKARGCDFGFKMGTGFTFKKHYYLGAHYEAGCLSPWTNGLGGLNKAWVFSIGYEL